MPALPGLRKAVRALLEASGPTRGELGQVNTFFGARAEGADRRLFDRADSMLNDGRSREDIYGETRLTLGSDGRFRGELSDRGARLDSDALRHHTGLIRDLPEEVIDEGMRNGRGVSAEDLMSYGSVARTGDVLRHPRLFERYPGLADTETLFMPNLPGSMDYGWTAAAGPGGFYINPRGLQRADRDVLSTLLHEGQHMGQGNDGHAIGGAPTDFGHDEFIAQWRRQFPNSRPPADIFPQWQEIQYRRLGGEVEARNTQARRTMSQAQRDETPPWLTQDTPYNKHVLRFADPAFRIAAGGGALGLTSAIALRAALSNQLAEEGAY